MRVVVEVPDLVTMHDILDWLHHERRLKHNRDFDFNMFGGERPPIIGFKDRNLTIMALLMFGGKVLVQIQSVSGE